MIKLVLGQVRHITYLLQQPGHCELRFIEKDIKYYMTREVCNVSKQDNAKEFRTYLFYARSRIAFEYFSNVSFDTTYNTNRYNLIFGSFVGVNHHGEKAPKDILTNQCASMQMVIEICMPITIHRWCIWHIIKKNFTEIKWVQET
ncbi:hypothetical protein Ahy_A07g036593 [Arachis hypogaea]|uniref:Protein FAR1-RELATED SEQUENCE n=1 Tax=Arachis hypogaea TaxID=3818 RepID=A0A445CGJ4_ARAHY|nr:hypothetical protein Ahy_A07g036593 [Arachis hypogaea]